MLHQETPKNLTEIDQRKIIALRQLRARNLGRLVVSESDDPALPRLAEELQGLASETDDIHVDMLADNTEALQKAELGEAVAIVPSEKIDRETLRRASCGILMNLDIESDQGNNQAALVASLENIWSEASTVHR